MNQPLHDSSGKEWTAPRLVKVGTITDVAAKLSGNEPASGSTALKNS